MTNIYYVKPLIFSKLQTLHLEKARLISQAGADAHGLGCASVRF